jgi:hypothetical protein
MQSFGDTFGALFALVGVGLVLLFIRFIAGAWDEDRIRAYILQRGGRLVRSEWAPLGKGWFGEKNDRIYELEFWDRDGNLHHASCKTSMWSGVYFTEDRIVKYAPRQEPTSRDSLIAENERLRAEVERLRQKP